LFRSARRRDWLWVFGCHGLAIGLTGLVLVGLCAPHTRDVPFLLYPHLLYWTVGSTLALNRVVALCWLLGWCLGPICFYRGVNYYRRGATRSLLAAGIRGRWAVSEMPAMRLASALRCAVLPTWLVIRHRRVIEDFEVVEPMKKTSSGSLAGRALMVLAISLNHWPVVSGVELTLCIAPSWSISLPSWAGPCTFGPARGQQSGESPCRELTRIP
jgi:hypothetical protein